MPFTLEDNNLGIYASEGALTVWADGQPDRIVELSLNKLEKLHKQWKHIIKEIGDNVTQVLMEDKKKRQEIFNLLKLAGFKKYFHFSGSQIKALLFYYKKGQSILWQFHSFYPELNLPDTEEDNLDYSKYMPSLDSFETANFYLLQNDSLGLAEDWPLSKIMKLFTTKAFISWISNPDNKAKIRAKEFTDYVEANPLDPEEVQELFKKG